jgi:hypothetical protein
MALTATDLRRIARRLDRRLGSANAALAASRGQTLHLQYRAGRLLWTRRAFRGGGTEGSA